MGYVCRNWIAKMLISESAKRFLAPSLSHNSIPDKASRRYWLGFTGYVRFPIAILSLFYFSSAFAGDKIRLNSGAVEPSMATTKDFIMALDTSPTAIRPQQVLHGLAQFSRHPTQDELKRLAGFGIDVLEPYQRTTYWVRVTFPVRIRDVQTLSLDMNLIRLHDEDRVDPKIWQGSFDDFTATLPGAQPVNYVVNSDGTLNLTIRFHADVTESQARKALEKGKYISIPTHQPHTQTSDVSWAVVTSIQGVRAFAKEDLVQWIGAGPLPFIPENDHTRDAVKVDAVQKSSTMGDGAGVKIGIFDDGVDELHPDFRENQTRILVSSAPFTHHATRVAGTVAGNGNSFTDFQYRGMAPGAELYDEPSIAGASFSVHESLVRDGMQLSNHSYSVSFDGEYNNSDRDRDRLIRGIRLSTLYIPPRLHIYSAGNQGCIQIQTPGQPPECTSATYSPYQTGYFALTKQLKNGLVVGNWNYFGTDENLAGRNQIFQESSLGPTHDGRIKPDVVAPGTDVFSTTCMRAAPPCSSPSPSPTPPSLLYYGGTTGTSMAAATVTGSLALVLQQYASTYLVNIDLQAPLPSTLRAVMIHTAKDIKVNNADPPWFSNADGPVKPTPGPDFVTGWGLVDAQKAVEVVSKKLLYEDTLLNQCETKTYLFNVANTDPFRVTLAWDDPPSGFQSNFTDPRLVNDLDLILIDPTSQPHYSWKLDQKIVNRNTTTGVEIPDGQQSCNTPIDIQRQFVPTANPHNSNDTIPAGGVPSAVRGRDHLNNVEVVDVDAPVGAGVWQIKVIGFDISPYSQPFSLVGYTFHDATIPPGSACAIHAFLCEGRSDIVICSQNPEICTETPDYTPYPPGNRLRGEFGPRGEKNIYRIKVLCELGFTCSPCVAKLNCPYYEIHLDQMTTPLQGEVYTYTGVKLLTNDTSIDPSRQTLTHSSKTLGFRGNPREEYLLVLSPTSPAALSPTGPVARGYEVTLKITAQP